MLMDTWPRLEWIIDLLSWEFERGITSLGNSSSDRERSELIHPDSSSTMNKLSMGFCSPESWSCPGCCPLQGCPVFPWILRTPPNLFKRLFPSGQPDSVSAACKQRACGILDLHNGKIIIKRLNYPFNNSSLDYHSAELDINDLRPVESGLPM